MVDAKPRDQLRDATEVGCGEQDFGTGAGDHSHRIRSQGDQAGAREALEKAKRFAEDDIKQTPDDASAHAGLAEALAWLGQKDAALGEIKRAQELLPESKDAFEGPAITEAVARIHAIFEDAAGAVPVLDGLL